MSDGCKGEGRIWPRFLERERFDDLQSPRGPPLCLVHVAVRVGAAGDEASPPARHGEHCSHETQQQSERMQEIPVRFPSAESLLHQHPKSVQTITPLDFLALSA